MKYAIVLPLLLLAFMISGCGDSGPSEAELKADAEAERLELLNAELEEQVDVLEESAGELENALDSLDVLFPALEQ